MLSTSLNSNLSDKVDFYSSAEAIAINSLGGSSATYTIPSDGFYVLRLYTSTSTPHDLTIGINDVGLTQIPVTNAYDSTNTTVPLMKNTVVVFNGISSDVYVIRALK